MPFFRGGALRFLARSQTDSFPKINLNRAFTGITLVALLGHELQHAVEVADAGGIASAEDLRALYQRLGQRTGLDQFDTFAARKVGYIVRQELSHKRPTETRFARTDDLSVLEMEDIGHDTDEPGKPAMDFVPVARSGKNVPSIELVRQ